MKIKNVTANQLTAIVDEVSREQYDGNIIFKRYPCQIGGFIHFTLRVASSKDDGAKVSASGRRSVALCWHGHRDVMQAIFDAHPDAILVTAMARYEGAEGFDDTYPATGDQNIGSMMQPLSYRDACNC